jgi:hypothetical protein
VKTLRAIFTTLGWFNSTGGVAGDWWVIVLAFVAVVVAFMVRDRLGMVLTTLVMASLGAFVFDPQSVIWNERLVPFWFITIHLSVGWLFGYTLSRWIERAKQRRRGLLVYIEGGKIAFQRDDEDLVLDENFEEEINDLDQESGGDETTSEASPTQPGPDAEEVERHVARRTMRATVAVVVLGLASTVPGLMPKVASVLGLSTTGNQVSSWAQWNYSGYQAKPAWPEYNDLMNTMKSVASQYGCGRAMWEYNSDQNRFGTPMALMLLPYWTNNCVGSMEGLFFESSATTPYHFLNQAELSKAPSNPQVGLNYGQLDVALGVQHLQMLGVKYYIAFSPSVVAQADADSQLQYITSTKAWPSPGVTWRIYLIKHSDMVVPLTALPNVVSGISSRVGWLDANQTWWLSPKLWGTVASTSGPASWPRATSITSMNSSMYLPADQVSRVKVGTQSISFHVSSVGVPVLVKISYYPRWKASGASGPYRVSPNLMVVVPTSHDVTMTYGSSPALTIGNIISDLATLAAFVTLWFALRRRGFLRR